MWKGLARRPGKQKNRMRQAEVRHFPPERKKARFSEAELIDRRSCFSAAERRTERQPCLI
jgi:hypothetical protein